VSYMVLYTGIDGLGAFGRCEELPEAVAEVERLRNEQGIEDAQIFRLEEVKFEIKPYFRVEIPGIVTETAVSSSAPPVPVSVAVSADDANAPWSAAASAGSAAASADVPSMVIPPPPPPPPAPAAPMGFDGGSFANEDEAIVGSRRGLFGR
jgi:hypothetical protein